MEKPSALICEKKIAIECLKTKCISFALEQYDERVADFYSESNDYTLVKRALIRKIVDVNNQRVKKIWLSTAEISPSAKKASQLFRRDEETVSISEDSGYETEETIFISGDDYYLSMKRTSPMGNSNEKIYSIIPTIPMPKLKLSKFYRIEHAKLVSYLELYVQRLSKSSANNSSSVSGKRKQKQNKKNNNEPDAVFLQQSKQIQETYVLKQMFSPHISRRGLNKLIQYRCGPFLSK